MAIHDENSAQGNAGQQQRFEQQPQQETRASAWSFHQQNLISTPIAAGAGGEYFTTLRTKLAEIYKDIAAGVDVKLIGLTRQQNPELKFTAMVVAICMPNVDPSVVGFHTLLLEATGEPLTAVVRTYDNMPVSVRRVPSDAWDSVLQKLAYDAVQAAFPNAGVYPSSAMVVPRTVSVEDKEVITNIARNAALACVNTINTITKNYGDLDLTKMDRECRLVIDVAFGQHQVRDVVNAPQRSSVLISFSSSKKNQNQYAGGDVVNAADVSEKICEVSGFVTPVWAPVDPQAGYGFPGYFNPNVPRPTQKFVAELVITSIRSPFAVSLPAVLLGFSSVFGLVDNDNWLQAFLPRQGGYGRAEQGKVDITDIGALNITANIGNELDKGGFGGAVDLSTFGNNYQEINKYLVSLFQQGLAISIDCPEAGEQSWYLAPFAEAALGNLDAYDQIYDSAMELTNGNFEKYFPHGTPMFTNVARVPLGYYMAGNQTQDIRNIDYTAVANMFANNPQTIHEYSNTFVDRPGAHAVRNLAIREGIISEACQGSVEFTGYALRPTLATEFIVGLSKAIADCKLPVNVNTPLSADQMRIGVPSPSFLKQSVASGTRTFTGGFDQARPQQFAWRGHSGFRRS